MDTVVAVKVLKDHFQHLVRYYLQLYLVLETVHHEESTITSIIRNNEGAVKPPRPG